jgi:D-glycero-alpha-D-manno-heptose 1-phosphate guanylyltransferase
MEAIVLAGGFGTRLRSIVSDVPKPMAPVAGRPFLELLLTALRLKGITRAILSIGYMADSITSHFAPLDIGLEIAFEIETAPLGTGGAITAALRHVSEDRVFVFNGDTYLDLEIGSLNAMWPGDRTPVVVARRVPDTERYGRLEADSGRISKFAGTGVRGAGLINAGCYLLPSNVFARSSLPTAFSFEQDYLARCAASSLRVFVANGKFIDIGVPEDYRRAQSELAGLPSCFW